MAYNYGIPDGTYTGKPTTASCYEKDGNLILDIRFAVMDPQSGAWMKNERGYNFEINKRHWLTNNDGAFNQRTIDGIRGWARGWNPQTFEDFYWFQNPDQNGTPFGNLAAVGNVELRLVTDQEGRQTVWVNDPNRQRGGRRVFAPDGAETDAAKIKAKWGAKAKAMFATMPKAVATATPAPAPVAAPVRTAPTRTATHVDDPAWAQYGMTAEGAYSYFAALVGEGYDHAKHDEEWFGICDRVCGREKAPDQYTQTDIRNLFAEVKRLRG